jgi:hypothetical protein
VNEGHILASSPLLQSRQAYRLIIRKKYLVSVVESLLRIGQDKCILQRM